MATRSISTSVKIPDNVRLNSANSHALSMCCVNNKCKCSFRFKGSIFSHHAVIPDHFESSKEKHTTRREFRKEKKKTPQEREKRPISRAPYDFRQERRRERKKVHPLHAPADALSRRQPVGTSAVRPEPNPTPSGSGSGSNRTSSHAPDRTRPARLAPRRAAHTPSLLRPHLLPQGNTSPAYVRRTTPSVPPATPHRRAPISGVDAAASGEPPPALLGPPPEPLRPPRRASWAPLPQTLTLAPGAGQCRCVLCSIERSVRPPSGPHGPLGSQLRYVECRAVVWVGGLSGHCWETAPAGAELCCIWAGRAWGGTCAGPLHSVVAVPGLTGNVHG